MYGNAFQQGCRAETMRESAKKSPADLSVGGADVLPEGRAS